jgi:hypothetical protein
LILFSEHMSSVDKVRFTRSYCRSACQGWLNVPEDL